MELRSVGDVSERHFLMFSESGTLHLAVWEFYGTTMGITAENRRICQSDSRSTDFDARDRRYTLGAGELLFSFTAKRQRQRRAPGARKACFRR
jgi:hypothetical protein